MDASIELKRKFIGIELDATYYEATKNRASEQRGKHDICGS